MKKYKLYVSVEINNEGGKYKYSPSEVEVVEAVRNAIKKYDADLWHLDNISVVPLKYVLSETIDVLNTPMKDIKSGIIDHDDDF